MPEEYKELSCKDCGLDCDFFVRARTVQEVVDQSAVHAREVHGWKGFDQQLYATMRANIRTVFA